MLLILLLLIVTVCNYNVLCYHFDIIFNVRIIFIKMFNFLLEFFFSSVPSF
jgi:hypothetical protein